MQVRRHSGDNERLQTGNNPILVDRKVGDVIGTWFNDAHGRSVVIGWGNAGDNASDSPNKKTIEDCPSTTSTTSTSTTSTTHPTSTKPTQTATTTWTQRGVPGKTGVEDEVPVLPLAGLGALGVAGASLFALKRRQR